MSFYHLINQKTLSTARDYDLTDLFHGYFWNKMFLIEIQDIKLEGLVYMSAIKVETLSLIVNYQKDKKIYTTIKLPQLFTYNYFLYDKFYIM